MPPPWDPIDDRVRGGSSQSFLVALPKNGARFHGTLDIKPLGGAGFASQFSPVDGTNETDIDIGTPEGKTNAGDLAWDLSNYDGVELVYSRGDGRVYTFIIKDGMGGGKSDDGREKAGINWEVDFKAQEDGGTVWKPWADFKAFYRGKEKDDAGELKMDQIRRVGLMMRRSALEMGYRLALIQPIAAILVLKKVNSNWI